MQNPANNIPSISQMRPWQKVFAVVVLAITAYLGMLLFNAAAPTVIAFCTNLWRILLVGVPLVFLIGYVVSNPLVIWGKYKTLSWNLTKFMISLDKLSTMDRHADYLDMKKKNLDKSRELLKKQNIFLGKQMEGLQTDITSNLKHAAAAIKSGDKGVASLDGLKVQTDKTSLQALTPLFTKQQALLRNFKEVSENWDFTIQKIRYFCQRKRIEYETLRAAAKACNEAEDFARGDTESAKLYNEGLRQVEEAISGYTAKIDQFEEVSKGVMDNIRIEKQMNMDEGLSTIEGYMKSGELMLPDFSTIVPEITDVSSSALGQSDKKYKLGS